jgi:hypothetical protein
MAEEFNVEAKQLLDAETGKPSLPTVHALLILYTRAGGNGRDRAGALYRFVAFDMLKRLGLERKLSRTAVDKADAQVISQALWGIYWFER